MKGLVTALVGDHPAAAGHGAGDQGVEQPERGRDRLQGKLGANRVGQQREAEGESEAAPGLGGVDREQIRRQADQQLGFGRINGLLRGNRLRRTGVTRGEGEGLEGGGTDQGR